MIRFPLVSKNHPLKARTVSHFGQNKINYIYCFYWVFFLEGGLKYFIIVDYFLKNVGNGATLQEVVRAPVVQKDHDLFRCTAVSISSVCVCVCVGFLL